MSKGQKTRKSRINQRNKRENRKDGQKNRKNTQKNLTRVTDIMTVRERKVKRQKRVMNQEEIRPGQTKITIGINLIDMTNRINMIGRIVVIAVAEGTDMIEEREMIKWIDKTLKETRGTVGKKRGIDRKRVKKISTALLGSSQDHLQNTRLSNQRREQDIVSEDLGVK